MKPSIGRVVHYNDEEGCNAAMIIDVRDDHVDLQVFHKTQGGLYIREIYLDPQGPGEANRDNTWHWPERVDE